MVDSRLVLQRWKPGRVLAERDGVTTRLGEDSRTGRACVIKTLSVGHAAQAHQVDLIQREAVALGALDHPAIPRLLDQGREDHAGDVLFHVVMEKVEGRDLRELVRSGPRLDARRVAELMVDALGVLEYLHTRTPPVIHRDVKPANLVLDAEGRLHLVDFGAVRLRESPDGRTAIVGTTGYMAPEQYEGRALPASDLHALGMSAIHLLTGTEPWEFGDEGARALFAQRGGVPPGLAGIIRKLTEPDPERRYHHAREAITDLRAFLDARPQRSSALPVMVGVAALVLSVAGGLVLRVRAPGTISPPHVITPTVSPPPRTPHVNITTPPPPSAPRRLVSPELHVAWRCLVRTRERTRDSRDRYLSWVNVKTGPTCQERIIYGLYTCYEDSIDTCRQAVRMAGDAAPEALRELAEANAELIPLLEKADRYWSDKDYLDDGCAWGRQQHPHLMDLYERAITANDRVREHVLERLVETARENMPKVSASTDQAAQRDGLRGLLAALVLVEELGRATNSDAVRNALKDLQEAHEALARSAATFAAEMKDAERPEWDAEEVRRNPEQAGERAAQFRERLEHHAARVQNASRWQQLATQLDALAREVKKGLREGGNRRLAPWADGHLLERVFETVDEVTLD